MLYVEKRGERMEEGRVEKILLIKKKTELEIKY